METKTNITNFNMNNMTHKQLKTLARRMMTSDEIKKHVPPFLSTWWILRKEAREKKWLKKNKYYQKQIWNDREKEQIKQEEKITVFKRFFYKIIQFIKRLFNRCEIKIK